jgi:RND superfamily putative drug exporter
MAHPRPIVLAWLCGTLVCGLVAAVEPGNISNSGVSVPGSQSTRVEELTRRYVPRLAGPLIIVVLSSTRSGTDEQQLSDLEGAIAPLDKLHDVLEVEKARTSLYVEYVSNRPGTLAVYIVEMDSSFGVAERQIPVIEATLKRDAPRGVSFALLGEAAEVNRAATIIRSDLTRAELIALPLTFCMLVVAFLSVAAALLPVLLAACVLACTLAIVHLISLVAGLSVFVVNSSSAIALGLSIDYSLIVVTRFREEREAGSPANEAIVRAMQSAGRAVVLSGLTIAALLPAVAVVGVGLFTSMALGGFIASLAAVLAATTLLPASLALLGDRLDRFSVGRVVAASRRGTYWRWLSKVVTGHPIPAALVSVVALLALATPASSLRLDFDSADVLPARSAAAHEEENIEAAFGLGATGLVEVIASDPEYAAALIRAGQDGPVIWRIYRGIGRWAEMYVALDRRPNSAAAREAVTRLRRDFSAHPVAHALVGGVTAGEIDLSARVAARLPVVVALAIIVAMGVLTVGFRSIVIPLKAMICSALSVAATLGVLAICFPSSAEGSGIAFFVPILTFALVLGLSIDYEVFLLTRLRDPVTAGFSTAFAVSHSLTRTARPITLAGLVVTTVFATFIFSSLPAVQQLGVAVTAGVLLDIGLVRWILSPACMVLAGRWNWWLPAPGKIWRARQRHAE